MAAAASITTAEKDHLSHDEFFTRLTSLFEAHRPHETDSIYLTQKRLVAHHHHHQQQQQQPDDSSNGGIGSDLVSDDQLDDLHPAEPLPVLIRATNGKSQRASTAISKTNSGGGSGGGNKKTIRGGEAAKRRAKNRKEGKVKLSTVVQPHDLDAFFTRYAECAKAGMAAGLKKRDRRANKKKKDKDKKKMAAATTTTITS